MAWITANMLCWLVKSKSPAALKSVSFNLKCHGLRTGFDESPRCGFLVSNADLSVFDGSAITWSDATTLAVAADPGLETQATYVSMEAEIPEVLYRGMKDFIGSIPTGISTR